jgi:hypothetical protein
MRIVLQESRTRFFSTNEVPLQPRQSQVRLDTQAVQLSSLLSGSSSNMSFEEVHQREFIAKYRLFCRMYPLSNYPSRLNENPPTSTVLRSTSLEPSLPLSTANYLSQVCLSLDLLGNTVKRRKHLSADKNGRQLAYFQLSDRTSVVQVRNTLEDVARGSANTLLSLDRFPFHDSFDALLDNLQRLHKQEIRSSALEAGQAVIITTRQPSRFPCARIHRSIPQPQNCDNIISPRRHFIDPFRFCSRSPGLLKSSKLAQKLHGICEAPCPSVIPCLSLWVIFANYTKD